MGSLELQLTAARSKIDEQAAELSLLRTRVYALNLTLVDAAPELLAALEGILEIGKRDTTNPKYDGYYECARAAIAKAKGAKS